MFIVIIIQYTVLLLLLLFRLTEGTVIIHNGIFGGDDLVEIGEEIRFTSGRKKSRSGEVEGDIKV